MTRTEQANVSFRSHKVRILKKLQKKTKQVFPNMLFLSDLKEDYNSIETLLETLKYDEYGQEVIRDFKMVAFLSPRRFYQVFPAIFVFVTARTPRHAIKSGTGQSRPSSRCGGTTSGGSHWLCHHFRSNWALGNRNLSQLQIRIRQPSSTVKTVFPKLSETRMTDKEHPGLQGIPQEARQEGESGLDQLFRSGLELPVQSQSRKLHGTG